MEDRLLKICGSAEGREEVGGGWERLRSQGSGLPAAGCRRRPWWRLVTKGAVAVRRERDSGMGRAPRRVPGPQAPPLLLTPPNEPHIICTNYVRKIMSRGTCGEATKHSGAPARRTVRHGLERVRRRWKAKESDDLRMADSERIAWEENNGSPNTCDNLHACEIK